MKWWIILLVVIVGCVKPPSLADGSAPEAIEVSEPEEPELPPAEQTEEPNEFEVPEERDAEDRVDIKILGASAHVSGTVEGRFHDFTLPYTDPDAIVFDIHERWEIPLNKARLVTYVNGNPYLKPSEKESLTEGFADIDIEKELKSGKFDDVNYTLIKEDGLLRGLACDFDRELVKFKLTNPLNETIPFFKDVRPRIKNAMTFYVNNRLLNVPYCEGKEELAFNESVECYKTNVFFIRSKNSNVVYEEANFEDDLVDTFALRRPGFLEQVKFLCSSDGAQVVSDN